MSDHPTFYLPPAASRPLWHVAGEFLPDPMAQRPPPPRPRAESRAGMPADEAPGTPDESMSPDGVLTISMSGVMMRGPTEEDEYYFGAVIDLDLAVEAMQRAAANPAVKAVMIRINSPGGTVDGSHELADAIHSLAQVKPTATFYENVGASAALLVGSQTGASSAFRSAMIGSVGTRMGMYDYSALFAKIGIEALDISSGGMKTAGMPGSKVTDEQKQYFRDLMQQHAQAFAADLARGRKRPMQHVQGWVNGKVHVAAAAKDLGMIDHVESFPQAMARLTQAAAKAAPAKPATGARMTVTIDPTLSQPAATSEAAASFTLSDDQAKAMRGFLKIVDAVSTNQSPDGGRSAADSTTTAEAPGGDPAPEDSEADPKKGVDHMSTTPSTAPAPESAAIKPATMAELKAACPGAPSDFLVEQSEKSVTVAQAKDAFLQFQAAQIRARDEELQTIKAKQPEPAAAAAPVVKKPGVQPIESAGRRKSNASSAGAEAEESATAELERRATALVTAHRARSIEDGRTKVLSQDADLREEYAREQQAAYDERVAERRVAAAMGGAAR